MASVSDEVPPTQGNKVDSSPSENKLPVENGEVEQVNTTQSTKANEDKKEQVEEEQKSPSTSNPVEPEGESQPTKTSSTTSDVQEEKKSTSSPSEEVNKKNIESKSQKQESSASKTRSVNFSSTVDDAEVSKPRSTNSTNTRSSSSSSSKSSKSSHRPVDFIDALVESYKLETSNTSPMKEEKKYVPKTNRSRLNPNWREHRTRRLMNKLEELSLWDREEELKASQAQSLREQKWEQIQDRQRNHDLCLNLMRQRHESEMESAVTLDRAATGINDENTSATIARAMNLSSPANILAYDLPTPPHSLKRHAKQEQENVPEFKTPLGRYRQFETNMTNKLDKINQKLQPDHEIMRAYSPYRSSIPPTAVPLFSETYSALLSVPDAYSTNKYNQYHYGVATHLHQPQHAPSPDYETRLRSYSNRDVRVPLKEQANDYSYYDDDNTDEYNRSNLLDDDRYTKYRSNPIDDDHYTKYRSNPIDNDYYTKYRSNPIDDDRYTKYRSKPIDDDYYTKYRSNPIDDDHYTKYRSNPIDDDYYTKHRSNPVDDDYYTKYRQTLTSRLDYSPPRRTTALASPTASALYDYSTVANTPREFSFLHSRQPTSNSIHSRSLNDDLNAITRYSTETTKKILRNIGDSPNDSLAKNRSSSSTTKHVNFNNQDIDDENISYNNSSRNYSSKTTHQPVEILSLSSTR
jgi:hypothetical protein